MSAPTRFPSDDPPCTRCASRIWYRGIWGTVNCAHCGALLQGLFVLGKEDTAPQSTTTNTP